MVLLRIGPLVAAVLALLLAPTAARAALQLNEKYEARLVERAMHIHGFQREPSPAGKHIDRIVIARSDIIDDHDPWPKLLNVVHVTTKEHVIRRELLFRSGEPYQRKLVAETARNLRGLFILAVAQIVPCRHPDPSKVNVLVVTKDLWSIRLNTVYLQTGALLQTLAVMPTEQNLLGRDIALSLYLEQNHLDLERWRLLGHFALGERILVRRLFGSRWRLFQQLYLYFDGDVPCGGSLGGAPAGRGLWCPAKNGIIDGAFARLRVARPLFSLATGWAVSLDGSADIRQRRSYLQDGSLATISESTPDPLGRANVPLVYDSRVLISSFLVTRSFGTKQKHDLSWGALLYHTEYLPPEGFPFSAEVRRWFEASVMPLSEATSAFTLRYATRPTAYLKVRNVNTFGISEDLRMGPSAAFEVRFGNNLLDSARSFIEAFADLGASGTFGRNIVELGVSARTRWQQGLAEGESPLVNNVFTAAAREITPPFGPGRLHLLANVVLRHRDLDRGASRLSGDLVRGYAPTNVFGRNAVRFVAEYRSRPINLWTLHLGLVAFYDGGTVWGRWGPGQSEVPFVYRQSLGLGIRGLFPQFDRETLRIDFAVPLGSDRGAVGTWISAAFGQSF